MSHRRGNPIDLDGEEYDPEGPPSHPTLPTPTDFHRLALEVLRQVLIDLTTEGTSQSMEAVEMREANRRGAWEWLFEMTPEEEWEWPLSAPHICDLFDIDLGELRDMVRSGTLRDSRLFHRPPINRKG